MSDVFTGQVSGDDAYNPRKVWFATRDAKPPYDKSSLRMYYPQWFLQEVNKFIRDDPSKSFTSAQQVLHNAEYHGFHHMMTMDYPVSDVAEMSYLLNDANDLAARQSVQSGLVQALTDAMRNAETDLQRDEVKERIEVALRRLKDPQLVEKLRRYLT